MDDCCGKCYWHRLEGNIWCCFNENSECYGCATEYRDICDEFEDRDDRPKFRIELI